MSGQGREEGEKELSDLDSKIDRPKQK